MGGEGGEGGREGREGGRGGRLGGREDGREGGRGGGRVGEREGGAMEHGQREEDNIIIHWYLIYTWSGCIITNTGLLM